MMADVPDIPMPEMIDTIDDITVIIMDERTPQSDVTRNEKEIKLPMKCTKNIMNKKMELIDWKYDPMNDKKEKCPNENKKASIESREHMEVEEIQTSNNIRYQR